MRSYAISDLTPDDVRKIARRLQAMDLSASIEGLYWLPIPACHLSEEQKAHEESCGPYVMALELGEDHMHLELLVRARTRLRCSCIHYASPALRDYMIAYLETMLEALRIAA